MGVIPPWEVWDDDYSPRKHRETNIIRRPFVNGHLSVHFSGFRVPVKEGESESKIVDMIDGFMNSGHPGEVLIDYFSQSKKLFRKLDSLDHSGIKRLFELIASLDYEYLLSNKLTYGLYNYHPVLFESIVRNNVKDYNPSQPVEERHYEDMKSDINCDFWDKPIKVNYNSQQGFKTENPEDMKKFSFLESLLNEFYKDKEEIFKRLKNNVDLIYSLKVSLDYEKGFDCQLDEISIVSDAYRLNRELEYLEDNPKELATRIDEFQETAQRIVSTCGIENIEEILPLRIYVKSVNEFKFSEKDLQAYFFTYYNIPHHYPNHVCIFFSKEGSSLKHEHQDYEERLEYLNGDDYGGRLEYLNGNDHKIVLSFLQNRSWIKLEDLPLKKEIERIETKAYYEQNCKDFNPKKLEEELERIKKGSEPRWHPINSTLGRILKIRDLILPEKWYKLRHLHDHVDNHKTINDEEALPFISQANDSELLTEVLQHIKKKRGVE